MTQASIFSECRSAYTTGKGLAKKQFESSVSEVSGPENLLLETIIRFTTDKRVSHFLKEDISLAIQETPSETLADAKSRQDAVDVLAVFVSSVNEIITDLLKQKAEIIQNNAEAGVMEEGELYLSPLTHKTNRTPDILRIKNEIPDDWEQLIDLAIKKVKKNYKPNQAEMKTVIGESFEEYLIPGTETITGYELKSHTPIPEKASEEVEV
jgi:hypothetical protein